MPVRRYVALLRGINVGGRNKVAMSDLRDLFSRAGFCNVATYIQSGNVLFSSDRPRNTLETKVETVLTQDLGLSIVVVVRSLTQMRNVVAEAPRGFGSQPDRFHSDAVFLKASLSPQQVLRAVKPRQGVDRAWPGPGLVYFERLSARRAQSRLSRLASTPEYSGLTIRNWNTTTRILGLLEELRS